MVRAVSLAPETLSTPKNAVVRTIGAVTISLNGEDEQVFSVALDAQEQIDNGHHVSFDTLKWWMQQDPAAQRDAFDGDPVHPVIGLEMLRGWLKGLGYPPVYTKGPHFDGALLDSVAETFEVEPAIPYRKHRDIRTIEDAFENHVKDERVLERFWTLRERAYRGVVLHNAVNDAKAQGEIVRVWMQELGRVED